MKIFGWLAGILLIIVLAAVNIFAPVNLFSKLYYPLLFACFLSFYRLFNGYDASDRVIALKVISSLVVSFCGILSFTTGKDIYLDIAIAWSVQAFLATLIFSKFIEGRNLND